jgi:hypothetical protein
MSNRVRLVQGDTRPNLVVTLTDNISGAAINVTAATARLKFRPLGSEDIRTTIVGDIVDGVNGIVVFQWITQPTSLTGDPGPYEGEIEITFDDGTVQTVYDLVKFQLRQEF